MASPDPLRHIISFLEWHFPPRETFLEDSMLALLQVEGLSCLYLKT